MHRTNAEGGSTKAKIRAIVTCFSRVSAAFCLESLYFVPCRQSGVSSYCCSAVSRSSIARPPPFLGVSSLNLAALRSGHFFCADLLGRGGVARRSWALKPTSLLAPGHAPKSLAQRHYSKRNGYSAASGRESGRPRWERGIAVRVRMARVRRVRTESNDSRLAIRSSSR